MRGAVDSPAARAGSRGRRRRLDRLLPRRRPVGVGGRDVPEGRGGGHLLLRDAARQARLRARQRPGARALRRPATTSTGRRRQGAQASSRPAGDAFDPTMRRDTLLRRDRRPAPITRRSRRGLDRTRRLRPATHLPKDRRRAGFPSWTRAAPTGVVAILSPTRNQTVRSSQSWAISTVPSRAHSSRRGREPACGQAADPGGCESAPVRPW